MIRFMSEIGGDNQKDTLFPNAELQRLLDKTGFFSNSFIGAADTTTD